MADVQAPVPFRAFAGLVRFELRSGQVWTRTWEAGGPPPFGAQAWHDGRKWRKDFGGRWRPAGKLVVWEWH